MEEYNVIYCCVEKWCTLVDQLNPKQRLRLGGTSLQNMLRIPSVQMRKNLLQALITSYDLTRKRFVLQPKKVELTVRSADVFHIYGLKNKGKDVMKLLASVPEGSKEVVPSRFLDKKTGEIVIDELIDQIVQSGSYDDDFVRRAVLVLIGTVIAPHSTKIVPPQFYKLVEDVDAIKLYNWNAFMLHVCIDGISKTVKDQRKFKWLVGNLSLIHVFC